MILFAFSLFIISLLLFIYFFWDTVFFGFCNMGFCADCCIEQSGNCHVGEVLLVLLLFL